MSKTLVSANDRGGITLPKALRGDATLFEVRRGDGGIIELVPQRVVPESHAWFWSERWQAKEREVDAEIAAGRINRYDDADAMFTALDAD